jgi:anaerobic magnesium-protoporphyrin IX monomethyl ester cyclase
MKAVISNPPWPGEGYGARSNIRWPHRRKDKSLQFPIYLAYTVSVLKKERIEAHGLDAVCAEMGITEFVDAVKKIGPQVVLLEVSTPSIMYDLETAQKVKKETGAFVVLCGPHASYFHKDIIESYTFVDACIRGEFEYVMRDLCLAIKKGKPLSGVRGITFRNKKKTTVNPDMPPIENLDGLPVPDRFDFKLEDYQQAFYLGKKTALVITSRGCPYGCTFCLWPTTMFSRRFRVRSPKNVVDEIESLIKEEHVDEIFFDDDTFTINNKRIIEMCGEIVRRGIKIPWCCMGRVDNVSEEMLSTMKKAGCYQIFYGFESGSEDILKASKKGITKKQIRDAVKLTKKVGLSVCGSFIFGLPPETKKTAKETLDFAKSLHANYVQFVLAAPFPGTEFYNEAKAKGLLCIDSWADLDGTRGPIVRTEHLSREDLEGIIRKAYFSYYTSPRVIWQNIKHMKNYNGARKTARGAFSVVGRILYYKK